MPAAAVLAAQCQCFAQWSLVLSKQLQPCQTSRSTSAACTTLPCGSWQSSSPSCGTQFPPPPLLPLLLPEIQSPPAAAIRRPATALLHEQRSSSFEARRRRHPPLKPPPPAAQLAAAPRAAAAASPCLPLQVMVLCRKGSSGLPSAYTMKPMSRSLAWSRMLRPSNTKAGLTMSS